MSVIIKGEVHASEGDFKEERELLAEGVDALVVEGSREDTELGWLHGWFGFALMIFNYLFASFVYTDHQTLVDIARGQGAEVRYTRSSDGALLENSHRTTVVAAFSVFYTMICVSGVLGILGYRFYGAGTLLMAGLCPVLLLRLSEMSKKNLSREKKMAEVIESAAEDNEQVVAVVGHLHANNIPEYLPDEMDWEVQDPEYGFFSVPMCRDLFVPVVRMTGTIAVVYPVFLTLFKIPALLT